MLSNHKNMVGHVLPGPTYVDTPVKRCHALYKQATIGTQLGISNKILYILVSQGADNLPDF